MLTPKLYWNKSLFSTISNKVILTIKTYEKENLRNNMSEEIIIHTIEEIRDIHDMYFKEIQQLFEKRKKEELSLFEKNRLSLLYQRVTALRCYLKKDGKVSNLYKYFHLYFLIKDRSGNYRI
ncbi:hypothetical protein [Chryseobacterium tructae]